MIIKDFELCFGKKQTSPQDADMIRSIDHKRFFQTFHSNISETSPMRLDYPSRKDIFGLQPDRLGGNFFKRQCGAIMPYVRRNKDKVLFVNAYLMPQE